MNFVVERKQTPEIGSILSVFVFSVFLCEALLSLKQLHIKVLPSPWRESLVKKQKQGL